MIQRNIKRSRAAGFSLVELMLALALGLIVVTGIVQLFVGNSQTYNVLNGQARMQENARFAMEFIARAARSAGYFGCANQTQSLISAIGAGSIPNLSSTPEFNVSRPVEGFDGAGAAWNPPLNTLPTTVGGVNNNVYEAGTGIDTGEVEPGTDVLVVRSLASTSPLLEDLPPNGEPLVSDASGIEANDIVMVANCEQAAMFRVTAAPADGADAVRLELSVGGGGPFDNAPSVQLPNGTIAALNLSPIGRPYRMDSLVGEVESTFFFIAEGAGGVDGDRPLALWQKVGRAAPVELVQGVENLQVLYGVDTSLADGVPNANEYVTAADLDPDNADVVSVRVTLTVNSVEDVTETGDPLRRAFTKTILLRNSDPEAV